MHKTRYLIIPILLLSLFLNIYGIWWGVPDNDRIKLVFGSRANVEKLSSIMKELRDGLINQIKKYIQAPTYFEDRIIALSLNGEKHKLKRSLVDSMRTFLLRSYGADEEITLRGLSRIRPRELAFFPGYFVYGGAYIYPVGLMIKTASMLGAVKLSQDIKYYFVEPSQLGRLYIAGRLMVAIAGIISVFLIYLSGRNFYNVKIGLIAALLYSIIPSIVLWNHYLKPHGFALIYVLLTIYFCSRLQYNKTNSMFFILAGASAGLGAGALLSYALVFLIIPAKCFIDSLHFEKSILKSSKLLFTSRNIYFSLLFFVLAFILSNPYILIKFQHFLKEFTITAAQRAMQFSFSNVWHYSCVVMRYQLGTCLWVLAIISIFYTFIKKDKSSNLFLAFFIPVFIYSSLNSTKWVHYGLIIIPFIVLFVARMLASLMDNKTWKVPAIIIFLGVFIYTLAYTLAYDISLIKKDTRKKAAIWISQNIPEGASIGMFNAPSPWRTPALNPLKYKIMSTGFDKDVINEKKLEYFLINEYDWLRSKPFPEIKKVLSCYEEIKIFEEPVQILGFKFKRGYDSPKDWCHPNPTFIMFKRIKAHKKRKMEEIL